jgi:hypothetical protein
MYIRSCTSKRQKAAQYMVNTSISGTSGIPAYRQAGSQISKEKEVTGIILTNGNKPSSFHSSE